MLEGVAVGDALGWPWERTDRVIGTPTPEGAFERWRRRGGSRFYSYEELLPAGTYSDDTQLMLCVARSLQHEDWFDHLVGRELPTWRLYERGGGRTVLASAKAWAGGKAPWLDKSKQVSAYFASGANGVAMRIAPHVVVQGDLLGRVVADGVATHGHPRALLGATLHAWTLALALDDQLDVDASDALVALRDAADVWGDESLPDLLPASWRAAAGATYTQSWVEARDGAVRLLETAADRAAEGALASETSVLQELGATVRATNGAGDVCAVAAAYLALRYASQPAQALQSAARQPGADNDTLAAMTGAVIGALTGADGLAKFPGVQDRDTIIGVADALLVVGERSSVVIDQLDSRPQRTTDRFIAALDQGDVQPLPDGRGIEVLDRRDLSKPTQGNMVVGHWVRCEDGQGLLVLSRSRRQSSAAKLPAAKPDQLPAQQLPDDQSATAAASASQPALDIETSDGAPTLELTIGSGNPRALIEALQELGFTGVMDGAVWRVHGQPIAIATTGPEIGEAAGNPNPSSPPSVEIGTARFDVSSLSLSVQPQPRSVKP
jgi:ADP-ribosylglycohydrolase